MTPLVATLRSRRAGMTEDLARLVECESPSEDELATADSANLVADLGSRLLGAEPERFGNHLRWSFGQAPYDALLLGHHDTVWPVGTLARWPFMIYGDRATGPGCFDMKAGIVQMFYALAALPSLAGLAVLVTADEEIGSPSSRALITRTAKDANAVLVCEPGLDGALKTARKGMGRYQLEITGLAAHAGLEPERGANAAIELAHQVLAMAGLGDQGRGTTVTPTVATAGTTANTVPAKASLDIDVRAYERTELERVDAVLNRLTPVVKGTRLTLTGGINRDALPLSASAVLYGLTGEVADSLGLPVPGSVSVGGASDGNITAGLGVPTLDGLGAVGAGAHAEGEWVDLAAMPDQAALLAGLVSRLKSGALS